MASLASYAAPFDNEEESSAAPGKKMNAIQQKRQKNKTMKRRDNIANSNNNTKNPKLEAMMNAIISSTKPQKLDADSMEGEEDDDDDSASGLGNMGSFQPLPPPSSASAQRLHNGIEETSSSHPLLPQHIIQNPAINKSSKNTESFTQLPGSLNRQYQQQYIPYYNQGSDDLSPNGANRDELLEKLHQIIYMLEEHKNNKNANSTEEIILYFFLGIFIIFIVDSFARVGKYVR